MSSFNETTDGSPGLTDAITLSDAIASPPDEARADEDVTNIALDHFCHYFGQLLDQMCETYPDDPNLKKKLARFEIGVRNMIDEELKNNIKKELITKFHRELQPHYASISERKEDFLKVELVSEFNNLWGEMATSNKGTVWEYLDALIQHSTCYHMYMKIPKSLKASLSNITSGEIGGDNMNLLDVSSKILSQVSQSDMEQFALGMIEDKDGLNDILRIASSQLQKMQEKKK